MQRDMNELKERSHSLFTSTVSGEQDGEVVLLGKKLTDVARQKSFAYIVGSLWIGHELKSERTEYFIDLLLKLLVDHGPYQSGAVNTMIASRAGKDLVSSLVSGLLTIGPRFGGAVNDFAQLLYTSMQQGSEPQDIVETYSKQKKYIPGIGHKKYRIDIPDPRVALLQDSVKGTKHTYLSYALRIEKVTTAKKPNLILNVDGTMAAIVLDLLKHEEKLPDQDVEALITHEFFNAFFVLSRSVGLIAHYLDQKQLGEGLFRLEPEQVLTVDKSSE